jgi:large subunit ribosomal protein L35
MPKMKTHRGAKKRFGKTASGKIRRNHAMRRHILTKKNSKRRRRLREDAFISGADYKRVRRMLVI